MSTTKPSPHRWTFSLKNEFPVIAALSLPLLALIAVGVQGPPAPLALVRMLLGLLFVLFIPGYCLQAALFPAGEDSSPSAGRSLDGPDRLALSFGLSIALVPPLVLLLDRLPWGLRLWPIVLGEGVLIALFSAIAWYRRQRLPADERFVFAFEVDAPGWWAGQDQVNRRLFALLGLALCMAAVGAAAIILLPRDVDFFTEFYALGAEGLAENYPRAAVVNEPVGVTVGIVNQERGTHTYRVEVWAVDPGTEGRRQLVAQAGPIELAAGDKAERPLTWRMPWPGKDQVVELLLFDGNKAEPYRNLRLWLNVTQ